MTYIFTTISLIMCCVAAFYLRKAQKENLKLSQEINVRRMERASAIEDKVREATETIVEKALSKAISAINEPETKGCLVTASSDMPKAYAVWKKVNVSEGYYGLLHTRTDYKMAYILVKMFDSDNAEENLKNATKLCAELNKNE